MSHKSRKEITDSDIRRVFLEPANPTHRQYEALRAYFLEGIPSAEAAARFGYTPGSFRVLCHGFRQDLPRPFFLPVTKGPRVSTKRNTTREKIIELRKQNLSIYDISRTLQEEDRRLSPAAVARVLKRPVSPSYRAAPMRNVRLHQDLKRRRWPMCGSWIYPRSSFAPSSAACSCSCRTWCRFRWSGCCSKPAFPARSRCPRPRRCARCWR